MKTNEWNGRSKSTINLKRHHNNNSQKPAKNVWLGSKYIFELLTDFTHWFPIFSIFDIEQLNANWDT